MRYKPSLFVFVSLEKFVSVFTTVTVALGTTAALGSFTRPVKVPVSSWQKAGTDHNTASDRKETTWNFLDIENPSLFVTFDDPQDKQGINPALTAEMSTYG